MPTFTANYTGIAEIPSLVFALRDQILGGMQEIALAATQDALEVADELCPVRTGYLQSRNQIEEVSVNSQEAVYALINDAPYALYVLLGTRYMRAQDFFTPAYVVGRASLESRMRDFMGGLSVV